MLVPILALTIQVGYAAAHEGGVPLQRAAALQALRTVEVREEGLFSRLSARAERRALPGAH